MAGRGERTRDRILADATEVFYRKGFAATTVADLQAATGATRGNLYFHFSGKEEIGLEVLRRERDAFFAFIDQALTGETPGAGLDRLFRQAFEQHRARGFVGGCLFGNTALEASDTAPVFAELVQEVFAGWIARLVDVIAAAQQAAQVRSDLPARELAQMVVATIEGGIMQARLQKSQHPLRSTLSCLRRLLELRL